MYDLLIAPFLEFSFMRRALLGSAAIALGTAPVGVFLMLRRMSLAGDAMAHGILPGAAIGYLISGLSVSAMTIGGLVAGVAVASMSGLISRITSLREDTSLAAFYLISLALGVLIISAKGSNVDLMNVLFGTVLALDNAALILLCSITSFSTVVLALFYRPLVMECVDPQFLRTVSGISAMTHFVFLMMVVLNLVGGFQALGTLMAVGIMILPSAAARFWVREIGWMIALAVGIAVTSGYVGLLLSYHFSFASGPTIILISGVAYVFSVVFGPVDGVLNLLPSPLTKERETNS